MRAEWCEGKRPDYVKEDGRECGKEKERKLRKGSRGRECEKGNEDGTAETMRGLFGEGNEGRSVKRTRGRKNRYRTFRSVLRNGLQKFTLNYYLLCLGRAGLKGYSPTPERAVRRRKKGRICLPSNPLTNNLCFFRGVIIVRCRLL